MTRRAAVLDDREQALTAPSCPPFWMGDPLIVVYAVRHAVTVRAEHVARFVRQSIEANVGLLPPAARRALIRDVRAWLDGEGAGAPAEERSEWVAALAALGAAS